jgi:cytochrome c-type biogenesis protein CcmH
MSRWFNASLLAMLALLVSAPLAVAAEECPKTSFPAIQAEVMCLICGTPLENAGGPQAENQRDFIRERVDECQSKEQIKTALVDEYGPRVLAVPSKSGFDLAAWIVPIIVLTAALIGIVAGAISWRRSRRDEPAVAESTVVDEALDADIRKYDL